MLLLGSMVAEPGVEIWSLILFIFDLLDANANSVNPEHTHVSLAERDA